MVNTYQRGSASRGDQRIVYYRFIKGHQSRVNRAAPDDFAVDECDRELFERHYWYFDRVFGYAYTYLDGKRKYLHRLVTGAGSGATVHFVDGNPHNNRRSNLRVRGRLSVPRYVPPDFDDGFGHWFAGFVDGEGCFQITLTQNTKGLPSCRCIFDITLRSDDAGILEELQRRTSVGSIIYYQPSRGRRAVRWQVKSKLGAWFLVQLFDRYPLRAKKAKDYAIWRQAVHSWNDGTKGRGLRADYSIMAQCREELRELRASGRIDGVSVESTQIGT